MFKKTLNEGQAGDNVGLLLRGVKREDVLRGQARRACWVPKSMRPRSCSSDPHMAAPVPAMQPCQQVPGPACRAWMQMLVRAARPAAALTGWRRLPARRLLPQVVCKPGAIKPYKRFEGELYALKKEEGGRHTPFFTNYKPQFFFRTADITGASPGSGPPSCTLYAPALLPPRGWST